MNFQTYAHKQWVQHLGFLMELDKETEFDLGPYPNFEDFLDLYGDELEIDYHN